MSADRDQLIAEAENRAMGRCADCRHWERGPEIRIVRWLPATPNEWGECDKVANDDRLAYIEAYGCDDRPEFITRDVFGCVQFEARK